MTGFWKDFRVIALPGIAGLFTVLAIAGFGVGEFAVFAGCLWFLILAWWKWPRRVAEGTIPNVDAERGIPSDIGSFGSLQSSGETAISAANPSNPRGRLMNSQKVRWTRFWKNPGVIFLSALGALPTLGGIIMALDGDFLEALPFGLFAALFWGLVFAHWKWPKAMERGWEGAGGSS